ncbi:MAG: hypothetical protein SGI98_06750 [Verrucomicrobiota bacterium]|nr:hypothetical protein [Verrucomicrobiota bacterium]
MSQTNTPEVSTKDRERLRRLAGRVMELATTPHMDELRRLWNKFNRLEPERPMIVIEAGLAITPRDIHCEGEWAKQQERGLLDQICHVERAKDDYLLAPRVTYGSVVHQSDFGVEVIKRKGDDGAGHGSEVWDAPIKDLTKDLGKLKFRELTYDRDATGSMRLLMESIYGGVAPIKLRSDYWWTQGLTIVAIDLIGLEPLMLSMYDTPDELHQLMAFLRDDHIRIQQWLESNGLLTLNNDESFVGSGGVGYTDLLPQKDWHDGDKVRIKDLWGLSESQETVGVAPDMFEEFIFPYQLPVISRFGLSSYGCCEGLDKRVRIIKQIPNLRRISVSPWAKPDIMAQQLGKDYIFSAKPNPSFISANWDEKVIAQNLRDFLIPSKGLAVELTMKDLHTLNGEPDRIGRWVALARNIVDEVYG